MATRVNYRLLTIIGLLLLVAVVIIGGLLFLRLRGNVERNLRTANEYFEAGDWGKAFGYYGRVISKQPGNTEALGRLLEVSAKRVPDTPERANEWYFRHLQLMRLAAQHAAAEQRDERYSEVLEEHLRAANMSGSETFWRMLRELADFIILQSTEENELVARAYFLRGASTLRLEDEQLTDDIDGFGNIRFPGEDDLEKHVELVPDSDIGWATLAFGRMAVARRLGLESRYAQEERNLELAKETFKTAEERNPQGIWTNLELLRNAYVEQLWHIGKNLRDPGSVSIEELEAIRTRVDEALDRSETIVSMNVDGDEKSVLDVVRYLRLADGFDGEARAAKILEAALDADPDNNYFLYNLALSQIALGEFEAALEAARKLMESEIKPVSLEARTQWLYRIRAAKLAFDARFQLFNQAQGEARDLAYTEMINARDRLKQLIGSEEGNAMMLEVDGKVAITNNRWKEAARLLEQALVVSSPDSLTLRMTASALEQNGQSGLAEERLVQAVEENPSDLRNHLALAEFYGRNQQAKKAVLVLKRLPDRVLNDNPVLSRAYQSMQLLATGTGSVPSNVSDPILIALAQADQAVEDNDIEGALAVLKAAGSDQQSVQLLVALAHVSSLAGQEEESLAYINAAIELQPNNSRLQLLRVRYGDPIEGVKQYCADRYPDPLERDALVYENLRSLVRIRTKLSKEFLAEGDAERAAEHEAVAAAAVEEMQKYRAAADEAVASVASAYIGRFEELLEKRQFEEARGMLPIAREQNFDNTDGNLAEARLELFIAQELEAEGKDSAEFLSRGVIAAQRATDLAPWSDLAWRTLGWGYELKGDLAAAERAYSESHRRNPGNAATLQKYVMLMLRTDGEPARALGVMREAIEQHKGNELIRDLWLATEATYGEPAIAYLRRLEIWQEDPDDRNNAMRLAALLASLDPTVELMRDKRGKRTLTNRQWLGMSSARQAELLGELKVKWDGIMDRILEDIEGSPDTDFSEAILHARIYVDRQLVDKAVLALKSYLETQDAAETRSYQSIAAAQFLIDNERTIEALELLRDALPNQTHELEVDAALGSLLYARRLYIEAIPHLRAALGANEATATTRHRLIECLLRTQQFEEGRKQLEIMREQDAEHYELAMLEAFLAEREGLLAGARGDSLGQAEANGKYRNLLKQAIAFDPDLHLPYELYVRNMLAEYMVTRNQALLDDAKRMIETASPVAKRSEQLILLQAELNETSNNPRRAVLDLEGFLRTNPRASLVRKKLVDFHLGNGNPDRAEDVIKAAIVLDEESSEWLEILGQFYEQQGEMEAATSAFIQAFHLTPTRRVLRRLNDVTRSAEEWDHEAALKMVQQHQRMLEVEPVMQSIHAKALARVRADSQAKTRIRQAYDNFKRSIQEEVLPSIVIVLWYEDLQVVFANDDPVAGEVFALSLIEEEPGVDDLSGLSAYWRRWNSTDAWEKATEYQEQAVLLAESQEPDRVVEMLTRLGAIQLANDQDEAAVQTYQRIVDLTPDDTMALNNYAFLKATLLNDPQAALPFVERAIKMAPDNPAIIDTMATIQDALGNYQVALTSRLKQLEFQPRNADLMGEIALLYADHTDTPEKAVQFAERASEMRPRDAGLLDIAGWVAFRSGRTAKGEDLILQSIRRQATARAHLHLGQIYLDQNRVEKAREQLRLALEIADDGAIRSQIEAIQDGLANGG